MSTGVLAIALAACGGGSAFEADTTAGAVTTTSVATTTTDGETATSSTAPPEASTTSTSSPPTTTTVASGPAGSFDFDPALLEEVIAEAADNPYRGLPGRDELATALLADDLGTQGFDLAGMELTVYPGGRAQSLLVMVTDDSTALFADESGGDDFLIGLVSSPVIADFGVERLVMRHSSADDEGPFVVTLTVLISDLQEAINTDADVFDRMAVQVERP